MKSAKELCLMTLRSDAKFEEKVTCGSENDMRNLVNFISSSGTSENLHFDVLLLSKVYYVWAKKVQATGSILVVKAYSICSFSKYFQILCIFAQIFKYFALFLKNRTLSLLSRIGPGRVMCHNTEEWCKIWIRIELRFGKWHEDSENHGKV